MTETPFVGKDYQRMILANLQPNVWYESKKVIRLIEDLGVLREVDKQSGGPAVKHMYMRRIRNSLERLKDSGTLITKPFPGDKRKLLYSLPE
jgi:hypothetical protein